MHFTIDGGRITGEVSWKIGGFRLNVRHEMKDGLFTIVPDERRNNPRVLDEFRRSPFARGIPMGESVRFTPNIRFDPWRARVGTLRAAYLAAFAKFGCRYIIDSRPKSVRRQLQTPGVRIISGFWLDVDYDGRTAPEMSLFDDPVAFLVVLVKQRAVLLPWLTGPEWRYPFPVSSGRVSFRRGNPVPWPRTLEAILDVAPDKGLSLGSETNNG